jgi:hypothetical protein
LRDGTVRFRSGIGLHGWSAPGGGTIGRRGFCSVTGIRFPHANPPLSPEIFPQPRKNRLPVGFRPRPPIPTSRRPPDGLPGRPGPATRVRCVSAYLNEEPQRWTRTGAGGPESGRDRLGTRAIGGGASRSSWGSPLRENWPSNETPRRARRSSAAVARLELANSARTEVEGSEFSRPPVAQTKKPRVSNIGCVYTFPARSPTRRTQQHDGVSDGDRRPRLGSSTPGAWAISLTPTTGVAPRRPARTSNGPIDFQETTT